MMKKIYLIIFAIIIAGCENLELVPLSEKSVEGFYKNKTEVNQAIMSCYSILQDVFVNDHMSYRLTEARSDNTMQSAYNDREISMFIETSMLDILIDAWELLYNGVMRCNVVLKYLEDAELSDEDEALFEGEAKFIRALLYFDLVRLWGDIPLVTTPLTIDESLNAIRNPIIDVYTQIENDLTDAASLLPSSHDSANKGRATKWAAKAFLGKVLMFRSGYPLKENRWEEAKALLNEVIQSGQFSFISNYADIFKYENEFGAQSVFSILFKSGSQGEGNGFPTRNAPNGIIVATVENGGIPYGGSPYGLSITNDLLNSFEEGDLRKNIAIRFEWKHNSGATWTIPFCQKYQNGPVAAQYDWDINWIMLRYTDVLMMYAECLNEISYIPNGEAFSILNQVRGRAGLASKNSTDVPNQQSFRLWVEKERRYEFCFENLRWFDLVRTDRALDVMQTFLTQYDLGGNMTNRNKYVYPIPQRVLNENSNIQQNPGN